MDMENSVLVAYPESGYPVEEYNGNPTHEYIAKRALLLQRVLKEQYALDIDVRLLKGNEVGGLEKYNCIIPFMVNIPQNLSAVKAKNALYIENPKIYTKVDLKADIIGFKFVDENEIEQIPTLDLFRADALELFAFVEAQKFHDFILKPEDGAGSVDQIILNKADIKTIESYLGKCFVIQPYLKDHDIFAINALMIDGKIEAHFGSINCGGLAANTIPIDYIFNETVSNDSWRETYDRILDFTRRFSKKHKVGGFIEIEFLQPKGSKDIFLLEVNPRISGWLESFCNEVIPYIDILVVPYLHHFGVEIPTRREYDLSKPLEVYHPADEGKDAAEYYDYISKEEEEKESLMISMKHLKQV